MILHQGPQLNSVCHTSVLYSMVTRERRVCVEQLTAIKSKKLIATSKHHDVEHALSCLTLTASSERRNLSKCRAGTMQVLYQRQVIPIQINISAAGECAMSLWQVSLLAASMRRDDAETGKISSPTHKGTKLDDAHQNQHATKLYR